MDFDTAEITALISAASICNNCLSYKTGLAVRRMRDAVKQITRTLKIQTMQGRCARCLKQAVVHRLG